MPFKNYSLSKTKIAKRKLFKIYTPLDSDNGNLRQWPVFQFYKATNYTAVCPRCCFSYPCSESVCFQKVEINENLPSVSTDKNLSLIETNENLPVVPTDKTLSVTELYSYCPICGQRFSKKFYGDYTDIPVPAVKGYDSIKEVLKVYDYLESIKNETERNKVIKEIYNKELEEIGLKNL